MSEEITSDLTGEFISWIYDINIFDAKKKEKDPKYTPEPIEILINSPGGDVYEALCIINCIVSSTTEVMTICAGSAMSAALYIFAAGHRRYCYEYSTFMYHEAQIGGDDSYAPNNKLIKDIDESTRIQELFESLLCKRTKITKRTLHHYNEIKEDWYFTPKEALKLRVVDEIINYF